MTASKPKRIGIFGGTFSPPHIGHVNAARAFRNALELDELLIIPTNIPPHKDTFGYASADERMDMCTLAFSEIQNAKVSDMEIVREGKSYTAKTVEQLMGKDRELFLLVGTDMFTTLDGWYMPQFIFANTTVVYMRRESDEATAQLILDKREKYEREYGAKIISLPLDVVEISSTELRDIIKRGDKDCARLPRAVMEYIEKKGLYHD